MRMMITKYQKSDSNWSEDSIGNGSSNNDGKGDKDYWDNNNNIAKIW